MRRSFDVVSSKMIFTSFIAHICPLSLLQKHSEQLLVRSQISINCIYPYVSFFSALLLFILLEKWPTFLNNEGEVDFLTLAELWLMPTDDTNKGRSIEQ